MWVDSPGCRHYPMRRLVLALTIAALVLVRVPLSADDLLYGPFGDYLESLRVQLGIPGMAAVIVGDSGVLWERAFGQRDVERALPAGTVTPFHLDGLTQIFTATLVLRCVEEGRLALEDQIGKYKADSPDANLTIRQVLTHTSGPADGQVYSYRPDRYDSLTFAINACRGGSFRATVAGLLEQAIMFDSVPGQDVIRLVPPDEAIASSAIDRYTRVLDQLATPYAVKGGRATPSRYAATTLTGAGGLISTARDLAQFDLALRKGVLLRADTITAAWQPPLGRDGQPLPHGMGWFGQAYNGDRIAWQFGVGDNASSCMMITVPPRVFAGRTVRTLILLANSDGLVKGFPLTGGDVTASLFGKLFVGTFLR
jgi:CubicO group peptidase (beta-lactamase class C family)